MIFNILAIIVRVIFGLCAIGSILGMFLYEKYPIFKNIFVVTGSFAFEMGLALLLAIAMFGF